MSKIIPENFNFLKKLAKNNNRDWFNINKDEYLKNRENIIDFAESLLNEVQKHDNIETVSGKKSLFRVYRDVRFSKDKSPYKTHWSGSFKRATKLLRGGYYFHIEPNNSIIAGGFWGPDKEDLARIREEIALDPSELESILSDKKVKKYFGNLWGEQLKTAPKGYPKDHPAINLLRYKQFCLIRKFSNDQVLDKNFYKEANETFKAMRPFLDYMSEVLTTDTNGQRLAVLK